MANDGAKKLAELVKKKRKGVCCVSCSGCERERRYGTESDNQYAPHSVQVLPIPPPFVPQDFDGMYKMRTLYTKRLDDVNDALIRARAQVQLYDQLRQATLGTTTGVGGVIAQALGTVDNLEQLRDSIIPGRRVYTDRRITRNTVANAYNIVMVQAGLTPEPTTGVTKSVLIDRIIDAGVDPRDLRDVIMSSDQPSVPPPPERSMSTGTPQRGSSSTSTWTPQRGSSSTSTWTPQRGSSSTSTRTQPPPTPPPET